MITIYILTMVFSMSNGHMTSVITEYNSPAACEAAKKENRENLRGGNVILATCTKK